MSISPASRSHGCRFAIAFVVSWIVSAWTLLAAPIQLHPQNPRYLLWRWEPTVIVTSGEHYGALLNYRTSFR